MIRRGVAGFILGISLFAASLAWSGFIALRTVLDPDRSQDVAESLFDDETVRDQLIDNIARAVTAAVPAEVGLTDEQVDAVGEVVLDDPRVEALFTAAFVDTHAAFLGEGEVPRTLDAGAVGAAARDALVEQRPELDTVLPPAPELAVELPTDRVPNAGPLRRFLQVVVPGLAALAAIGVALALFTTNDRPSVLRRAGWWAIGASAMVLLIGFGVPWLAENVAPDQSEVISALLASLTRTTRGPAVTLAIAGAAAIVVSFAWPDGDRRRSARPSRRERPTAPAPPERHSAPHVPRQERRPPPPAPPMPPPPAPEAPTQMLPATPAPSPPAPSAPDTPVPAPPPPAPSPPAPSAPDTPVPAPPPPAPTPPPAAVDVSTTWVEGVGWVVDPNSREFPAEARWVPGVGYVIEAPEA